MAKKKQSKSASRQSTTRGGAGGKGSSTKKSGATDQRGMSTASRVALASAAGVLAATAVGLAGTRKGREISRKAAKHVGPIVADHVNTVLDVVEASLAQHGLADLIPPAVREHVHASLGTGAAAAKPGPKRRAAG